MYFLNLQNSITVAMINKSMNKSASKNKFMKCCLIFLFRTLLRVGHVVVSPHTLRRRDITIFKWGALISVNSSKTKQKGSSHKIPISRSENLGVCPVYWLEKLLKLYPGVESDMLFCTKNYMHVTYSIFKKSFKRLFANSKISEISLRTFA